MNNLLYADITYKIRGACYDVWKSFGGAFKEKVIENSLLIALKKQGLKIEKQKHIKIYFDNNIVGFYTPDIIVNELVLIELKCKTFITQEDRKQFWFYLKASQYKIGLLINFGTKKLEIERRVYDTARNKIPRSSASLSA